MNNSPKDCDGNELNVGDWIEEAKIKNGGKVQIKEIERDNIFCSSGIICSIANMKHWPWRKTTPPESEA